MDKYDPAKRVWLAVDEWGTWFDATPGSNPGFLQQQNSLRDGLVAAINFNIFTAHADRVKMANIAQMVNVLQAIILTDGTKMVLTPTYHVFAMYLPWQDAQQIPMELKTDWFARGDQSAPMVSASAVRDTQGKVHIALVNLDPSRGATVSASLAGLRATAVSGRILTAGNITAINTFDAPDAVAPRTFDGATLTSDGLTATLPARSVVVLDVQ
jgi:alpha-N-arabinofuranosidase